MIMKSFSTLTQKKSKKVTNMTKSFTELCLSVSIVVTSFKAPSISSEDGHDMLVNDGRIQEPFPIEYSLPAG